MRDHRRGICSGHVRITDPASFIEITNRKEMILGYGELVRNHIHKGFKAYLVTIMFKSLRGGTKAILAQMIKEVTRIYSTFITRVVRNPRSPASSDRLPILIACPDLPVPKRKKQPLADFIINDGLHFHGILLVPRHSRLKGGVRRHFRLNRARYVRTQGRIKRIRLKRIRNKPAYVTDYVLKTFKRGKIGADNILVLPRARSELSERSIQILPRAA